MLEVIESGTGCPINYLTGGERGGGRKRVGGDSRTYHRYETRYEKHIC